VNVGTEVFEPYEPAVTPVLESVTDVPNGLSTAPAPPETRISEVVEVNDPPDPEVVHVGQEISPVILL
jgi:hypothetical protein